MVYGYCRVSTKGQAKDGNSIEAQEAAVREAGAEEIYADAFTGTKKHRPQLDKLLKVIQNGDKVVVTKLDRIARSATQGIALIDMMLDKGVTVHILNMGIMDNTPTGRLIRTIMLAFAEFERDMIVERTQEGKAIAKQKDDFKEGRPRISGANDWNQYCYACQKKKRTAFGRGFLVSIKLFSFYYKNITVYHYTMHYYNRKKRI